MEYAFNKRIPLSNQLQREAIENMYLYKNCINKKLLKGVILLSVEKKH